jgi:hypothetical protein
MSPLFLLQAFVGRSLAFVIAAAAALPSWILSWEVRGCCPHIPGGFGSKFSISYHLCSDQVHSCKSHHLSCPAKVGTGCLPVSFINVDGNNRQAHRYEEKEAMYHGCGSALWWLLFV